MSAYTVIDLFAGCGGIALGFASEGFHLIDAVESDPDAAVTYAVNVDRRIRVNDIQHEYRWPRAHCVIGGPPCQGFSQIGTRDRDDPRNALCREYLRVIRESRARLVVLENVPPFLRSAEYACFRDALIDDGFTVVAAVLNAADYGVPQIRRRAIVIGSRRGTPELPAPTVTRHRDVRYAFSTPTLLPHEPDGVRWHRAREGVRAESVVRYRAVPASGGNRFQMAQALDEAGLGHLVPASAREKTSGTTDVFGRLWWDRPAPTIRTEFFKPEKGRYLHPEAHRAITVREAARLQSFPDDVVFPEHQSMVSVARQIGNAVPPLLTRAIARSVRRHLDLV